MKFFVDGASWLSLFDSVIVTYYAWYWKKPMEIYDVVLV